MGRAVRYMDGMRRSSGTYICYLKFAGETRWRERTVYGGGLYGSRNYFHHIGYKTCRG